MNQELTTREKINTHLLAHGITEYVEIEEDAEDMILMALENKELHSVSIDDGALLIEFNN
jgi:hypothetical protein